MDIKFVSASEVDADDMYLRLKEVLTHYRPDLSDPDDELMVIYKRLRKHIGEYTLVKYRGEKVGFYYFHKDRNRMKIEDLYVYKRFRCRGVGTSILRRCMSDTEQPLYAEVYFNDIGVRSLFTHNAFIQTKRLNSRVVVMENMNKEPYMPERHYDFYFS